MNCIIVISSATALLLLLPLPSVSSLANLLFLKLIKVCRLKLDVPFLLVLSLWLAKLALLQSFLDILHLVALLLTNALDQYFERFFHICPR